jgi:ribosomal-protein-alanine N-acetyltransferase
MKEMIGLKKFKDWVTGKKEEVGDMLFQPLVREEMLSQDSYRLNNDDMIEISLANKMDLDDIVAIQEACYEGEAPWGRMAVNNELRNKRTAFFLMGHHEEQAIAFIGVSMRHTSLHVTNIATIPEYQKQGIATFLIETIIDLAQQLNRERITLEVRVSNEGAKRLYRKIGFRDGRIKRNYYQSNGEDALDMIYRLEDRDE